LEFLELLTLITLVKAIHLDFGGNVMELANFLAGKLIMPGHLIFTPEKAFRG